jgi:rRNA maturation endonuclease Nob1
MSDDIFYLIPIVVVLFIAVAVVLFLVFGPCIHLFENEMFCSSCGVQLRYSCPGCNELYTTSSFCSSCGFDLRSDSEK